MAPDIKAYHRSIVPYLLRMKTIDNWYFIFWPREGTLNWTAINDDPLHQIIQGE